MRTRTIAATDEGGDLGDLAADRGGLGLGQVDVGHDQPHRGIAGRTELVAKPGGFDLGGPRAAGGRCRRRVRRRRRRVGGAGRGGVAGRRRRSGGGVPVVGSGRRIGRASVGRGRGRVRVVQGGDSGWAGRGGVASMIPARPRTTGGTHVARAGSLRSDRCRTARPPDDRRPLLTAELLSIGSELTVGETRDTNAGELARALTARGVEVRRLTALPDRLDAVTDAFADGAGAGRPRRLDRRPRPDPGRPDARGDRRRLRRDARSSTRRSRPGCASCGAGAACRSPSSTSSRPG